MRNLKDVELNDYAAAQRRHIAIIGKFNKDVRADTVPYSDAVKHLQRKLYAVPHHMEINDESWFSQKLVTANRLSDSAAETAVEVQFDGVFGDELASEELSPAAIGGKLFGKLLSALDDLMPFTHPSFDTLLMETFKEFTQVSVETTGYDIDKVRNLIEAPEVRGRFLAYLRSDPIRRNKYFASLRGAAIEKARELGIGDPNKVLDRASDFLGELKAESEIQRKTINKIEANQDSYKELKRSIHKAFPPKWQPEAGQEIGEHLHVLFSAFHRARATVEEIANCEPMLTLMVFWLFTKFGEGEATGRASRKIWENFYRGTDSVFSKEALDTTHDGFKKPLETLEEELLQEESDEEKKATIRAMAQLVIYPVIDKHRKVCEREYVFRAKNLMKTITLMHDVLMNRYVPGIDKKLEEYMEKIEQMDEKLLKGAGKRTGPELMEWLEQELGAVKGWEMRASIKKLFKEELNEVNKYLQPARQLYRDGLRKVYAGGEGHDGVAQAPPGGSVNREAVKQAPETDGHQEDRSRSQDQSSTVSDNTRRAVLGAGGNASGMEANTDINKHDESFSEFTGSGDDLNSDASISESGDREEGQAVAEEDAVVGTEDELRTPEQRETAAVWIDDVRRKLIDDLVTSTELGKERACCRAILLGETVLAADPHRSPLNRSDRSVLVHFILRMVEKLGADPKADREQLLKPQEIDWQKDKEFLGLPFPDMVVPHSDDGNEIGWLTRFVTGWKEGAENIVKTAPQAIAEFKDVRTLVEELAKSGKDGNVTIINDTLEGHCEKAVDIVGNKEKQRPSKNMLISKECVSNKDPGSIPPPGIVYISTLAFANENERSLDGVYSALFDRQGPLALAPGDNGQTLIQSRTESFGDGCTWGIPVFIGKRLISVTGDRTLPTISIDKDIGVSLASGVLWLAGVNTSLLNKTIDTSLVEFIHEMGMTVGSNESFYSGWSELLTTENAIAAQVKSRICSLAMLERVRSPNVSPNFRTVLDHALQDIRRTQNKLMQHLEKLQESENIRVGANRTPLQALGRRVDPILEIGGQTKVAAFFSKL